MLYKNIRLLTPEPEGDGGVVLNNNFRTLADKVGGYIHHQSIPAAEWVVHHGLNKPVHATAVDEDGWVVSVDLRIVDLNTLIVRANPPMSGTIYVT